MSLIQEINSLRKSIKQNASSKDVLFYEYLTDEDISLGSGGGNTEILEICSSAYTGKLDKIELVKKLQATKAIKTGFHYTDNLIELVAMALHDFESEKDNLEKYSSAHSLRDSYLINRIFSDIEITQIDGQQSKVDRLVKDVLVDKNLRKADKFIFEALKEASDLMDIFTIEEATRAYISLHESTEDKNDIDYLLRFYLRAHKVFYFFLSLIFYLGIIGSLLFIVFRITPYVTINWPIIEPFIAIAQTVLPTILSIILIGLGVKTGVLAKIKPLQKWIVMKTEIVLFRLLGVDLIKVININEKLP